jgi:hypothetical protein
MLLQLGNGLVTTSGRNITKATGYLLINLVTARMPFAVCDHCQNIPLDLFSNKDFVHVIHPSLKALKSSAQNGCHSCTLFYGTLFSLVQDSDEKRQNEEGLPVSLTRWVDISKGPGLSISCGSYVGIVSCVAGTGFTQGMRRRYRLLE